MSIPTEVSPLPAAPHLGATLLIVRDSAGYLYACRTHLDPDLSHVYQGVPIKAGTGPARGTWVAKAGQIPRLVRKRGSNIVQEIA